MPKITAELGPVVIFDEKMYVKPFGTVVRWMDRVVLAFGNNARKHAPVKTGELKAGIRTEVNKVGPKQLDGIIESTAAHTMYVIRGTTGPIMSNRAWGLTRGDPSKFHMLYRKNKKSGRRVARRGMMLRFHSTVTGTLVIRPAVRGQQANNFLMDAWVATARTHSSLRGFEPVALGGL